MLDGESKVPPDVTTLPAQDVSFDKPGTCLVVAYAKKKGRHTLSVQALDGIVYISHVLFY
jgi:hypothetical protein